MILLIIVIYSSEFQQLVMLIYTKEYEWSMLQWPLCVKGTLKTFCQTANLLTQF